MISEDKKRDNKDLSCRSNFIIPSNTATITYQVRIQYLLSTGVKVIIIPPPKQSLGGGI